MITMMMIMNMNQMRMYLMIKYSNDSNKEGDSVVSDPNSDEEPHSDDVDDDAIESDDHGQDNPNPPLNENSGVEHDDIV